MIENDDEENDFSQILNSIREWQIASRQNENKQFRLFAAHSPCPNGECDAVLHGDGR